MLGSNTVDAGGPKIYRPPTNTDLLTRQQQNLQQLQKNLDRRNRQDVEAYQRAQAARKKRDLEVKNSLCRARNIDEQDCHP